MAQLINFSIKLQPSILLIGKQIRYSMQAHMQGDNRMPAFWQACFAQDTFAPLEAQGSFLYDDAYVGTMTDWDKGDGDFSYIVGMLMKPGATIPQGYAAKPLPTCQVAIGYIKGKDTQDVCAHAHALTEAALRKAGHKCDAIPWCMERYGEAFAMPDADGDIVLDYYIPLDGKI